MITGVVTTSGEAVILLVVRDAAGEGQPIEAMIDTGFNGALTLPFPLVAGLGLTRRGQEFALLADGSSRSFDLYEAVIDWDGAPRSVVVLAADGAPLVGMDLLRHYEVTIRVIPGGAVTITAL
jgi:clan AA aspartic protease